MASRQEIQTLAGEIRAIIEPKFPLWCDIHQVRDAFAVSMITKHADSIRTILNEGEGVNVPRRRLGKKLFFERDSLPDVIATFFLANSRLLEEGETMELCPQAAQD